MAPNCSHGKLIAIGELLAEASDVHCLFDMPVGGNFSTLIGSGRGSRRHQKAKPPASGARRGL
jgi:hypothetical protein